MICAKKSQIVARHLLAGCRERDTWRHVANASTMPPAAAMLPAPSSHCR
jgi:hypothetical protein